MTNYDKTPIQVIEEAANDFCVRCSAIGRIIGGNIGLTDNQAEKLNDLISRENGTHPKGLKLTNNMFGELAELRHKLENPTPTDGMVTYVHEWLNEYFHHRRKRVKSKYIDKGNATEEDGFTLMCLQLNLGMVYKNEERRRNDFIHGECDLDHEQSNTVFDNKSSYILDTFPMWDNELPNKGYEHQIRGYMWLWNRENGAVTYTLNDLPIDLLARELRYIDDDTERAKEAKEFIFTRKSWEKAKAELFASAEDVDFVEIPDHDRIRTFRFTREIGWELEVQKRVKMCRKLIKEILTNKYELR